MANQLLMPKATAVWLVDSTSLSFDQIANFCHLHPLEVQAIADGEAAQGIKGMDPIQTGQLSRDDIEKAEKDPSMRLKLAQARVQIPETKRKGSRYTPLSKRQERPNAILWLVRNHPELKDAQISRLVGTTKSTIEQIRNRTHWNVSNLQPVDPVTLGFCSQVDLDMELEKASTGRSAAAPEPVGDTLLSASDTQNMGLSQPAGCEGNAAGNTPTQPEKEEEFDADTVFAKLKSLKNDAPSTEEE